VPFPDGGLSHPLRRKQDRGRPARFGRAKALWPGTADVD